MLALASGSLQRRSVDLEAPGYKRLGGPVRGKLLFVKSGEGERHGQAEGESPARAKEESRGHAQNESHAADSATADGSILIRYIRDAFIGTPSSDASR